MSIEGYVLAGGAGRRMGLDKARAPWQGLPLAAWVAEQIDPAVAGVTLVRRGRPDGLPWCDRVGRALPVVYEPDDGPRHPLAGVVCALTQTASDHVLIAPCDTVGLTPEVARRLVAAGPCVASDGERVHPLLAVLPRERLDLARQLLAAQAPCRALVEGLPQVRLDAHTLVNANRAAQIDDPLRALAARLPAGQATERLLTGERRRLAARGILAPPAEGEGA